MNDDDLFIKKLYTRCMAASMLALAGGQFGQIVSAAIAGRLLESSALPVMAVALPVQFLFSAAGALLGVGGTVVCAGAIGKGRFEECHRAFTAVYLLTLAVALALALLLLPFIDPLVRFLGAGPAIFESSRRYVFVLVAGGVCSMSVYPAYNLLRLDGRMGTAAAVFFVQAAVTIGLDLVFLVLLRRGVEAVAMAAVAGAAVSGLGGAALLFAGSKNFRLSLPALGKARPREIFLIVRNIIAAGSPSAMESLCILGYSIVLNRLISRSYGLAALSSFKLIDSFNAFALIFIYAVSGPVVQFVGVFGAEKDSKSVRQLLAQVFKWGALFVPAYTALCEILAPRLAGLFGMASPEALGAAVPAIRIFAVSLVIALVNNILIAVYQAENRPFLANILTASRLFIWITAAAPLLSRRIGVTGIWHGFWIAETLTLISAAVLSLLFRRGNRFLSPLLLVDREAELRGVYKSFSVKNTLESITESSAGITEFCEQNSLGSRLTMAISLAIEEMLVVIRAESLPEDAGATMNVRLLIEEHTVILRIRNGGLFFNPVEFAQTTDRGNVEDSGDAEAAALMGIKMILALALNIDYRNTFGVNNTTILLERQIRKKA